MKKKSSRYYLLSAAIMLAAILFGVYADYDPVFNNIIPLCFFTALFVIGSFFVVDIGGNNIVALSDAIGFAALLSFGPAFAAVVFLTGMLFYVMVRGDMVFQRLVHLSIGVMGLFVAGWLYYEVFDGRPGLCGGNADILAAFLAGLVLWMVDRVCIYATLSAAGVKNIKGFFKQLKPYFLSLPPLYIWGIAGSFIFCKSGYFFTAVFIFLLLIVFVFMKNQKQYLDTIRNMVFSMAKMIDARDSYTAQHSFGVAMNARRIAEKLELSEEEVQAIYETGLLHDIGKVGIRDSILLKEGPLDNNEWSIMRQHPVIGSDLVTNLHFLSGYEKGIRSHHERWDGKGYPDGLKHRDIHLWARIIAICDSWDAMRTDRPYRKALSVDMAIAQIEKGSDSQFDPALVPIAIEVLRMKVESANKSALKDFREISQ